MLVINRFRVTDAQRSEFDSRMATVIEVLSDKPGLVSIDLLRNLDEPELWVLASRWADVGSYRRALGGYESKLSVVPVLSMAIDEPSAYGTIEAVGENRPRGS
ncbi:antibiotic biosynthesis monooxygenase family protein [Naumannella halotolerans]|uniref:Antibiotic biosynthesis monooxygenase n=1 Tax=Naumannella halotolerans TaxID=993414 RepID=A0A4V3ENH9_9ACTN|nr:antibiotic biosynthesis monooxygenase family protein [Naumannella halotolerans]TDT33838.1 antibiotic biosynthesis monooxygenase [Naumannella halotolerans]